MNRTFSTTIIIALIVGQLSFASAESATEKEMDELSWTFDQAENVACFTVKQVVNESAPILVVVHDAEDHDWQFLTGQNFTMDDAMIVSISEIVSHDPTLLDIGTMPPGYTATRVAVGEPWNIEQTSD